MEKYAAHFGNVRVTRSDLEAEIGASTGRAERVACVVEFLPGLDDIKGDAQVGVGGPLSDCIGTGAYRLLKGYAKSHGVPVFDGSRRDKRKSRKR